MRRYQWPFTSRALAVCRKSALPIEIKGQGFVNWK